MTDRHKYGGVIRVDRPAPLYTEPRITPGMRRGLKYLAIGAGVAAALGFIVSTYQNNVKRNIAELDSVTAEEIKIPEYARQSNYAAEEAAIAKVKGYIGNARALGKEGISDNQIDALESRLQPIIEVAERIKQSNFQAAESSPVIKLPLK